MYLIIKKIFSLLKNVLLYLDTVISNVLYSVDLRILNFTLRIGAFKISERFLLRFSNYEDFTELTLLHFC